MLDRSSHGRWGERRERGSSRRHRLAVRPSVGILEFSPPRATWSSSTRNLSIRASCHNIGFLKHIPSVPAEHGSCRGMTLCFGRTSLLVSPVACTICSFTHFSCSNFLPVCFNGRDLPHSQTSPHTRSLFLSPPASSVRADKRELFYFSCSDQFQIKTFPLQEPSPESE